jgi:hypothetical protein
MQTIDRTQSRSCLHGALLAGTVFFSALAFAAPDEALAACGGAATTSTSGTHPASAGTGGTHAGPTPSGGSASGANSCGVTASKSALSGAVLTSSLPGVHTGAITGNGGKRNGASSSSRTASTITHTHLVHGVKF